MLKNFWYAVAFSSEVTERPARHRLLGQDLVLQRQADRTVDARSATETFDTLERYRFVWVFVGDLPEPDRPPIPDWDEHFNDPSLGSVQGEFRWNANYARVLENGVDIAHTPFVHGDDFGNRDRPQVPDYTPVMETPWQAEATVAMNPPLRNVRGLLKLIYRQEARDVITSTAWFLPNLLRLHVRLPVGELIIYDTNIPLDDTTTLTKWIAFRTFFTGKWANPDAARRVRRVFLQDAAIVESQRPELLPVDLAGELHVASDALGVAFRRRRQELLDAGWGVGAAAESMPAAGRSAS